MVSIWKPWNNNGIKNATCQWLMPVIPATWEDEIGRTAVQGKSRKIVFKTPNSKITRKK
jgi:hypothetical protein